MDNQLILLLLDFFVTGYFNILKPFILVHLSLDIVGWPGVPGLGHDKGGFFPVFADSKPTISNDRCTSIRGFNILKYTLSQKTSNNNNINFPFS